MRDIAEALLWIPASLLSWVRCVFAPVRFLRLILNENDEDIRNSVALEIWIGSFIVTLGAQYPAYSLYGVDYERIGFVIANLVGACLNLILTGLSIHQILAWNRVVSRPVTTLKLYAVMMAAYLPIQAFFTLPTTYRVLSILHGLSLHKASADVVGLQILNLLKSPSDLQSGAVATFLSFLAATIYPIYIVFFAEAIAFEYRVSRFPVYRSVTIGILVGALPSVPLQVFVLLADYGSMRNGP